jgi:hypothetical protein
MAVSHKTEWPPSDFLPLIAPKEGNAGCLYTQHYLFLFWPGRKKTEPSPRFFALTPVLSQGEREKKKGISQREREKKKGISQREREKKMGISQREREKKKGISQRERE